MISTHIQRRAAWVAEDGPPSAAAPLHGFADSRWRRVAADVLGRVVDPAAAQPPSALVLATTRLEEAGRSVPRELEALADALRVPERATVFGGANTVAAGLLEAASLARVHGDSVLLIVELTEAEELAVAFTLHPDVGELRLTLTQDDPLTGHTASRSHHRNPCWQALSLFETDLRQVLRLDTDERGEFSIRIDHED